MPLQTKTNSVSSAELSPPLVTATSVLSTPRVTCMFSEVIGIWCHSTTCTWLSCSEKVEENKLYQSRTPSPHPLRTCMNEQQATKKERTENKKTWERQKRAIEQLGNKFGRHALETAKRNKTDGHHGKSKHEKTERDDPPTHLLTYRLLAPHRTPRPLSSSH